MILFIIYYIIYIESEERIIVESLCIPCPPDGDCIEAPIEMTDEVKALEALNELVEKGTFQGFLMLLNQQEKKEDENK